MDTKVSDEEAAQKAISYVNVSTASTTDENGETKEYTEDEKKELEQQMKDFQKSAEDDFTAAAENAGYTVSNYYYGEKDESYTLDDAVIEAANKLKEGEVSKVISTDSSLYVVRMDSTFDEEKTEEKKETIVQQRKDDHYTEVCDGYKEGVAYELNEDEWAKVKFDELFTIKQTETSEDDHDHSHDEEETTHDHSEEEEEEVHDENHPEDGAEEPSEKEDADSSEDESDS